MAKYDNEWWEHMRAAEAQVSIDMKKSIPAPMISEMISVKDRTPMDDRLCLVTTGQNRYYTAYIYYEDDPEHVIEGQDNPRWMCDLAGVAIEDFEGVTHWVYLAMEDE